MRRWAVALAVVVVLAAAFLGGRVTAQSFGPVVTVVNTTSVGWGQITMIKITGPYGKRACQALYESPALGAAAFVEVPDYYICE